MPCRWVHPILAVVNALLANSAPFNQQIHVCGCFQALYVHEDSGLQTPCLRARAALGLALWYLHPAPDYPVLLQMLLHTGDMRWQPRLADHPALKACKVDVLYMDTTYCSPKHVFPSQVCCCLNCLCSALLHADRICQCGMAHCSVYVTFPPDLQRYSGCFTCCSRQMMLLQVPNTIVEVDQSCSPELLLSWECQDTCSNTSVNTAAQVCTASSTNCSPPCFRTCVQDCNPELMQQK